MLNCIYNLVCLDSKTVILFLLASQAGGLELDDL